jgi:hypothetical protein
MTATYGNHGKGDGVGEAQRLATPIPPRRYLSREEAAEWLGLSVDTFMTFDIPYVDFGERSKRWDLVDIIAYAEQNKSRDSARISAKRKGRQTCVSSNERAHRNGGPPGMARTVNGTAKVLGLSIKT